MGRTVLSRSDVELLRRIAQGQGSIEESDWRALRPLGLTEEKQVRAPVPEADDYKSRLLKYIPAEIVALYITLDAMIRSGNPPWRQMGLWVAFWVTLVGVPAYLWRVQRVRKWVQLLISTTAFAVWVFAIGGPFAVLSWYSPLLGGLVLVAYTFFIPIIEG